MKIKVEGLIAIEDDVNPNGEYYPENAFFWPDKVPVKDVEGKKIGSVTISRDGDMIIGEGELDISNKRTGGWSPIIGYARVEKDEILRAQIIEIELTKQVDDDIRFYNTES